MASQRHSSRAVELLLKVVATGWFERETIANELVVTEEQLHAFLNGTASIPLDRQLCLAQFVIERLPPLARQGHRLLGQVRAALAFNDHITQTHADAPPMMYK